MGNVFKPINTPTLREAPKEEPVSLSRYSPDVVATESPLPRKNSQSDEFFKLISNGYKNTDYLIASLKNGEKKTAKQATMSLTSLKPRWKENESSLILLSATMNST